jgi:hypothetical protein
MLWHANIVGTNLGHTSMRRAIGMIIGRLRQVKTTATFYPSAPEMREAQ